MTSTQTSPTPDEMIQVVRIDLMCPLMELISRPSHNWESQGGYVIKLSDLPHHLADLIESDGPDDSHSYMVTPYAMEKSKFEGLEEFGGW